MLNKITAIAALGCIIFQDAQAQQTITFEESDNKHSSTYSKRKKKERKANSLTFGLLSAFNGSADLYYERKATDFLSVQMGGGVTYRSIGNDLGNSLNIDDRYPEALDYTTANGTFLFDVDDQAYHYTYRSAKPGFMLSVAPKFYFNENVMDGFYISPKFAYKMYRYNAQRPDETVNVNGLYDFYNDDDDRDVPRLAANPTNEFFRCMDYTLTFGGHYQQVSGLVFGFSISAGVRDYQQKRQDVYIEYTDNTLSTGYFRSRTNTWGGLRPLVLFNITLGGCF
jgi:hypothetical protein